MAKKTTVKKAAEVKEVKAPVVEEKAVETAPVVEDAVTEKKPAKKVKSVDTLHVEGELKSIFGTKVSIEQKGKKGTIQLEYYSTEELNRLIELLKSVQ